MLSFSSLHSRSHDAHNALRFCLACSYAQSDAESPLGVGVPPVVAPAPAEAAESRDDAVERRLRVELGVPHDTDESLLALERHGIGRHRVRELVRNRGFGVLGPRSGISDADRLLRAIRLKTPKTLGGSGALRALAVYGVAL